MRSLYACFLDLSFKVALETIDVIGEVDVAYTHDSDSDDYVYKVWFKVSASLLVLR